MPTTVETELRNLFEAHGAVEKITLVTDRDTGRSACARNSILLHLCSRLTWRPFSGRKSIFTDLH